MELPPLQTRLAGRETEMQPIQTRLAGRQPTLESQRSAHDHFQPNTQAPHRFLSNLGAASLRRNPSNFQAGNVVDAALAAAAKQHRDGTSFLNQYAHISRRSKLPLHNIFDLFVRLPPGTSESQSFERWLRQDVSTNKVVQ